MAVVVERLRNTGEVISLAVAASVGWGVGHQLPHHKHHLEVLGWARRLVSCVGCGFQEAPG